MVRTTTLRSRSLTVAASYFLLVGGLGLVWPLLGLGPSHPEFEAKSFAFMLGAYWREAALDTAFIVVGAAILWRRSWAATGAYITLAVGAIYTANEFAWGFAKGKPSVIVLAVSFVVVGLWNGLWAFVVYRNRNRLGETQHVQPAA